MAEERTNGVAVDGAPAPAEAGGTASLDKVREILFGSQARDYDKRFARLEDRFVKESNDLKDEVRRRFDSLEIYIKKELESIGDRLRTEQGERRESDSAILREVKERSEAFVRKTEQLDEMINRAQRDLREQLLEQAKQLSDDMRQKHERVLQSLAQESSELRSEKTDRSALAAMFTEIALRLNGDVRLLELEDLNNG